MKKRVFILSAAASLFVFGPAAAAESCDEAVKLIKEGIALSNASAEEESKYQAAVRGCPQMPEAYFNLGVVLDKRGKLDEAVQNFEKARELKDSSDFMLAHAHTLTKKGDLAAARAIYETLKEDKEQELNALIGLAHVMSVEGKLNDAAETLFEAKALEPENEDVLYNLAVLLERSKRLDEALVFYESVLSVNPDNQKALTRAGLTALSLKEWSRAQKYLEKGSAKEPNNLAILRALGVCYERLGQYERAEISLKRAISVEPDDVATSVNLAIVLIKTSRESLAEEVLLEIEHENRTAKLYSALGWAQLELGKYKNAERSLKLALDKSPKNRSARENLITLYKRTGREEGIEELLAELEPDGTAEKIKNAG